MPSLRLILADQLTMSLPALRDADKSRDIILMAEVVEEATYVRHHQQKIAFLFSAMRHFAQTLRQNGYSVRYVPLDDPDNVESLFGEVHRALQETPCDRVVVTSCGEYRLQVDMQGWSDRLDHDVDILDDDRFLCSQKEFDAWASERKTLTMEYFYRDMRRKTGLLMEGDRPVGGQWNLDAENRKKFPRDYQAPIRDEPPRDEVTETVIALVRERFADHFGTLDVFYYDVTRDGALRQLDRFVDEALPHFGDYQDAMATGVDFANHSLLSTYLNAGLLLPMEVCRAAEEAYKEGSAPLNAVEGFIRQIIGWREFVRGLYWLKMPQYKESNALGASRPLPDFYWTGETDMHCLAEAVRSTRDHAYAHHIQRLMVLGNFALLAGVAPDEINEWFLVVYADAYEWVQLPNTHGMAIWADGGVLGTKPYAASGAYINRMSNYCKGCQYTVSKKTGEGACPFNVLYWDFMMRNEETLRPNRRLSMVYRNLDKKTAEERQVIRDEAASFLHRLGGDM